MPSMRSVSLVNTTDLAADDNFGHGSLNSGESAEAVPSLLPMSIVPDVLFAANSTNHQALDIDR